MNWCDRCTCTSHEAKGCSCPCHVVATPRGWNPLTEFRVMTAAEAKKTLFAVISFQWMFGETEGRWFLYGKPVDRATAVEYLGEEGVRRCERDLASWLDREKGRVA